MVYMCQLNVKNIDSFRAVNLLKWKFCLSCRLLNLLDFKFLNDTFIDDVSLWGKILLFYLASKLLAHVHLLIKLLLQLLFCISVLYFCFLFLFCIFFVHPFFYIHFMYLYFIFTFGILACQYVLCIYVLMWAKLHPNSLFVNSTGFQLRAEYSKVVYC